MEMLTLLVTLLLPVSVAAVSCPRSCDCGHVTAPSAGGSMLEIRCFVWDMADLDTHALAEMKEDYALKVSCDSALPTDLNNHALGFNSNICSLTLQNCKLSFIFKQAFYGLKRLELLAVHDASNHHLQLHPESLDYVDKLTHLELTGSGILKVPTLCALRNLESLNISGNSLISLTMAGLNCTEGDLMNLKTLDISNNYFLNLNEFIIHGKAFSSVEIFQAKDNSIKLEPNFNVMTNFRKLRVLSLSNNNITEVPDSFLHSCKEIQEVDMSSNNISQIPTDLFINSQKLLMLTLRDNELSDGIWKSLTHQNGLLHLDLTNNHLTAINQTTLRNLPEVIHLLLGGNSIETIPEHVFQNNQRLQALDLARNSIMTIDKDAFAGLLSLNRLYLQENHIYSANPDFLSHMNNLKRLNISHNYFSDLPSLKLLGFLENLDASRNNIEQLSEETFIAQVNTRDINLSNNRLSRLSDSIFLSCNSLENLDLSNNLIHFLHPSIFMNLGIKTLFLQGNKIESIGKTFSYMEKLHELNLSSNQISDTLQRRTFPGRIEMLDLSDNRLEVIRPHAFDNLDNIRVVDLRFNQITTLQPEALRISTSRFSQTGFLLSDNPFVCDCTLLWLRKWDQSTEGPLIVGLNTTRCVAPPNVSGRRLTYVPPDEFLCKYTSICKPSCTCCAFEACDCKYTCPEGCECFHSSDYTSSHIIRCNTKNVTSIARFIPRVTTLLDYSGSDIDHVPLDVFMLMDRLQVLMLNHTKLSYLQAGSFNGLTHLKKMFLNNNKLKFISSGVFDGLTSLQELYLDNNELTSVTDGLLDGLTSLRKLTLGHNYFQFMTDYLSKLVFQMDVSLENVRWVCNCILYFTAREKPATFVAGIRLKRNVVPGITCAELNEENGLNKEIMLRDHSPKCSQNFNPYSFKASDEPVSDAPRNESIRIENSSGDKIPPSRNNDIIRQEMTSDSDDDRLKLFLPAIVAGTVVFIVIILLACRHELINCWLYTKFRCNNDDFEMVYDKARPYDAFVVYHPMDEVTVQRELAIRLEHGRPRYRLQLQHRDRPPEMSDLTYIENSVKASCRTIIVLSGEFIVDNSLLKCVTHCVRQDSLNRLITINLGKIDPANLDPVLQAHFRRGKHMLFGETWFWDKLIYCLPVPGVTDRDARAGAHPYATADAPGHNSAMMDNRAYEEPLSPGRRMAREPQGGTEYNMPSMSGYGYGGSEYSGIYEEIPDPPTDMTSVKYAIPWNEADLKQNVQTLTRSTLGRSESRPEAPTAALPDIPNTSASQSV
ncbi:toll-like receptor Tollo isoform X2 [Mya arenaria]|nr:toll-like receptor Tollo isoform X2 [Mya arenaria]XP_052809708.1 toll-like receptor Tollo isoform X2 [Mya arenaria]XP_052809709.1 toll-like receptor Tollo isoform X2 [Mya arenaria]XP_052809710.1 toll-like receptor Tollo isoform X2 [Mya arenaria]XP_052809711.1 toll-like receptor Tollo isoform X2 [Mya arenaria]